LLPGDDRAVQCPVRGDRWRLSVQREAWPGNWPIRPIMGASDILAKDWVQRGYRADSITRAIVIAAAVMSRENGWSITDMCRTIEQTIAKTTASTERRR
jgi:hypothetical protein